MKIHKGKIYIVRRSYAGVYKIKIIELTETSVLFQNLDNKLLNPQRMVLSQFESEYKIMECIDPITDIKDLLS